MKHRLRRVAVALATFLALVVVYAAMIEPRVLIDEEHYVAEIPALGEVRAGTEIALFSDLQVGMWLANEGVIERIVGRVVDANPDAALIAGDFLYSSDPSVGAQVDTVMQMLSPLVEAEIPTFAVLGNHDYAVGAADELTQELQDHGIEVLRNESAVIPSPLGDDAADLYVVGLGPARPGLTDVDEALREVPDEAPRVVLMHNPTSFPELPAGSAPLALAGHTHCGQIALPGSPRWSYLALTEEEALVAKGFAPAEYGAPGNRLFVTCGIGFSLLPVRFNAAPQVVFFELVPGI